MSARKIKRSLRSDKFMLVITSQGYAYRAIQYRRWNQ
jgi:hypothetical protein